MIELRPRDDSAARPLTPGARYQTKLARYPEKTMEPGLARLVSALLRALRLRPAPRRKRA